MFDIPGLFNTVHLFPSKIQRWGQMRYAGEIWSEASLLPNASKEHSFKQSITSITHHNGYGIWILQSFSNCGLRFLPNELLMLLAVISVSIASFKQPWGQDHVFILLTDLILCSSAAVYVTFHSCSHWLYHFSVLQPWSLVVFLLSSIAKQVKCLRNTSLCWCN